MRNILRHPKILHCYSNFDMLHRWLLLLSMIHIQVLDMNYLLLLVQVMVQQEMGRLVLVQQVQVQLEQQVLVQQAQVQLEQLELGLERQVLLVQELVLLVLELVQELELVLLVLELVQELELERQVQVQERQVQVQERQVLELALLVWVLVCNFEVLYKLLLKQNFLFLVH
jgi:hypothetical protein